MFRPQSLGRLVASRRGRQRREVVARFEDDAELRFSFATNSKTEVELDGPAPSPSEAGAAFLPTQELLSSGRGSLEMALVAEGFRKVGMSSHLSRNGSLGDKASLFWDEPEANLDPRTLHSLARVLVELASIGTQVFLATHSLFFLRELEIALQTRKGHDRVTPSFVALARRENGADLTVGRSTDEITPIDMLDADLEQSDRYLALIE